MGQAGREIAPFVRTTCAVVRPPRRRALRPAAHCLACCRTVPQSVHTSSSSCRLSAARWASRRAASLRTCSPRPPPSSSTSVSCQVGGASRASLGCADPPAALPCASLGGAPTASLHSPAAGQDSAFVAQYLGVITAKEGPHVSLRQLPTVRPEPLPGACQRPAGQPRCMPCLDAWGAMLHHEGPTSHTHTRCLLPPAPPRVLCSPCRPRRWRHPAGRTGASSSKPSWRRCHRRRGCTSPLTCWREHLGGARRGQSCWMEQQHTPASAGSSCISQGPRQCLVCLQGHDGFTALQCACGRAGVPLCAAALHACLAAHRARRGRAHRG